MLVLYFFSTPAQNQLTFLTLITFQVARVSNNDVLFANISTVMIPQFLAMPFTTVRCQPLRFGEAALSPLSDSFVGI